MGQRAIALPPTEIEPSWDDCRAIFESATSAAVYMLDAEGRVATWSARAEDLHGFTAQEIIGEHFSALFTASDRSSSKPEALLARAIEFGNLEREEARARKDGSSFRAFVITSPLRDAAGALRGFGEVVRDLSASEAAAERLRVSEERFHHLVDAVSDYAIFMLDAEGNVATWNEGARRTKGYTADEIIGRHFSTFYPPEDRAEGKPARVLDEVRRTGRFEEESWRVRKDGTRFWANVVITALRNESGEIVGFAKVTRDLSERRAAAEELQRSEDRFRLLVESIADYAIYMLDTSGRVASWNIGAERMKGYTAAEILGKDFSIFFTDPDASAGKPRRELTIARESGRFSDEGWRRRKDGSLFWAYVVLTALRDERGELIGYAKITRDMTTQREAQEIERRLFREQAARAAAEESERRTRASEEAARAAAHRAEEEARRADQATRMKDAFLATVSHELRTPLNAMVGYAALLRARMRGDPDPAMLKAIDAIQRNANAQARIVDDILDVSRIITGKLRIEVVAMDIVAIVKEAMEVVRPSASAKDIRLALESDSDVVILVGDPERLRQVAWNLLSNAVKFTDRGGTVVARIAREDSKIMLSVRDTGRGIEPDFLPHVFERFKQADSSTTRRFGGLGLGLAIVRHIVELHGGQVSAESEGLGKGAMFRVSLPIRAIVTDPETEPRAEAPRARSLPSLAGVRVVVVDDDADARDLITEALETAGAEVSAADSVSSALVALRETRPHVLVSDIGMPGEDGYALMEKMRALKPDEGGLVPSIALTAYTRSEDRTKALAAGFTTHIGKPVNPDDLIAAVANLAAFRHR